MCVHVWVHALFYVTHGHIIVDSFLLISTDKITNKWLMHRLLETPCRCANSVEFERKTEKPSALLRSLCHNSKTCDAVEKPGATTEEMEPGR